MSPGIQLVDSLLMHKLSTFDVCSHCMMSTLPSNVLSDMPPSINVQLVDVLMTKGELVEYPIKETSTSSSHDTDCQFKLLIQLIKCLARKAFPFLFGCNLPFPKHVASTFS